MAQLILTWSPPADCNGCTFEYRYKLSSASTYITGATSNTVVTINGLVDAETYNYSVRTVCPDAGGNLRSRWLNGSSVTCNTEPPLLPTPTPTITPTPTPTPTQIDCNVDIEYATIVSPQKLYWNFATIGVNSYPTTMRFRIQKNGSDVINTTTATQNNTQYIEPLENWMGNTTVNPGDAIIFTVTTESSGSGGNTIGNMGTYTTTGTSGYMPNVAGTPVAPNATTLNSQSVDPDGGAVSYSFTVTSGVNYGLNCTYFQ